MAATSLYVGGLIVVVEMITTVMAVILNLVAVVALRKADSGPSENYNFLLQILVHNNLLICVLVKSFEVVFSGLASLTNTTR